MRLASIELKENLRTIVAVYKHGQYYSLPKIASGLDISVPESMLELIDMGLSFSINLEKKISSLSEAELAKAHVKAEDFTLLAPIPKPRKNIFGIGLNYTEHVAESARSLDTSKELPQKPVIFSKPPTAVTGPDTAVILNSNITQQLDHEVELAVVIGKKGKYIKHAEALDYVYGYTVINDISARDCRRAGQWIVSKGQDTFAPMGPHLVTANEVPDPQNLDLWFTLNGVEKQRSNTKLMLFSVRDLIEDLSTVFTLEPGDIIASGTPAGVGAGRVPQEWMKDGDQLVSCVEGIGTLKNYIKEIKE